VRHIVSPCAAVGNARASHVNIVLHTATHCNILHYDMLQCVALCCSVLHCVAVCCSVLHCVARNRTYGVALVSRIDTIIGLFCKRALYNSHYSAKKTWNFVDPTSRSHPIVQRNTLYHTVLQFVALRHTRQDVRFAEKKKTFTFGLLLL